MNGLCPMLEKQEPEYPYSTNFSSSLGYWSNGVVNSFSDGNVLKEAIFNIREPLYVVLKGGEFAVGVGGTGVFGEALPELVPEKTGTIERFPVVAYVPPYHMKNLGDPQFCADYGIHHPYLAGSMANGISSCEIVEAMGQNGMLGFFGSAGLPITSVSAAIDRLSNQLGDAPYGINLIHSPNEPSLEAALVDLYLHRGIKLIEASAYLDLTLPLVRYRVHGIHCVDSHNIVTPNRIIAKASRVEVATKFFSPPPERLLRELVTMGDITEEQAHLASFIPVAQDLTAEADSGGHTDNRPAIALLPTMLALQDKMQSKYNYKQPLRVGAAGGIATPASTAAAFAMGAAYVMTGSINQACNESGTSNDVREMLAQAQQADITMAPAADMFEMGVTVQVLKRGTMFAMRAAKLYEIYRSYDSIEDIPPSVRAMLEKNIFHGPLDNIWKQTCEYFDHCDPTQISRAENDPKHRMALVFRWYLGQASRWANSGEVSRKIDYQIWCGPAMGAFNEWVKGSFLEHPQNRDVVTVAFNLLYGAAVIMRINSLRYQGIPVPPDVLQIAPLEISQLKKYFN